MGKVYAYFWEIEESPCGNVYFIRDGMGNIKIGVAKNPLQRKKDLQTANPNELEIFFIMKVPNMWIAKKIEYELHGLFADIRKKGEWFEESPILDWLRNGELLVGGYKFQNADW